MKSSSPFSLYDYLYLRLFYQKRLNEYDLPENQVGWRSRYNQETRFKVLSQIGDVQGRSLLDLGCGLGCFYGYLKSQGWDGQYTGIDLLGAMVRRASKRFPGVRFERRDILKDLPKEQWDYVFISGVFNHKVKDNWGWIEQMVRRGLSLSRQGMAFNVLAQDAGWQDEDLFYADVEVLEGKVKEWSGGNYRMVRGYIPEDVTVYLYKDYNS